MTLRYAVVIEQGTTSYGAYVLDLTSCVAVCETREEAWELIQEAITLHIEDMKAAGQPVPLPTSGVEFVDVAA